MRRAAAGYKTWWCTNHKANDYLTGYIMETADEVVEVPAPTGDDAQLLDVMDKIPEDGHHFVVLHIMGSHLRYGDRVPTGFPVIPGDNKRVSEYDTSIAYTDDILRRMREKADALGRHEAYVFTNDLIFDILCGLMHVSSYANTDTFDLSDPAYGLSWGEALTMHGKIHGAEDVQ